MCKRSLLHGADVSSACALPAAYPGKGYVNRCNANKQRQEALIQQTHLQARHAADRKTQKQKYFAEMQTSDDHFFPTQPIHCSCMFRFVTSSPLVSPVHRIAVETLFCAGILAPPSAKQCIIHFYFFLSDCIYFRLE